MTERLLEEDGCLPAAVGGEVNGGVCVCVCVCVCVVCVCVWCVNIWLLAHDIVCVCVIV